MPLRLALASLHLFALAIGVGGLWSRARALHHSVREHDGIGAVRRALTGNAWWALALVLWIVTGVWRLLVVAGAAGAGPGYYLANQAFLIKMGLLALLLALEVWPMKTLLGARRVQPYPADARRIEIISYVQCVVVLAMVFASVSAARGSDVVAPARLAAAHDSVHDSLTALGPGLDTETTSPAADAGILTREIAMPLGGIDPAALHSNFDELRGGTRRHEALDIMAARGTPVLSAVAGRVLKLFTSRAGGLMIYATDSSERFILMYAHLNNYAPGLHDGSILQRGQVIGAVGFTGNAVATAPHLHFALARAGDVRQWWKGTPIDPLPILQAARR